MNSIYIDANATNSKIIDSTTNNRWEYKINGGLSLPTGTNISVASSFINQKGVAGGSIEIEEDLEEDLVYGYYMSDTKYGVPNSGNLEDVEETYDDQDQRIGLNILAPFNFRQNYLNIFVNEGDVKAGGNYDNAKYAPATDRGNTEIPMPLMTLARTTCPTGENFTQYAQADYQSTGWSYAIPLLNKTTIKIKKGVYTLQKIADIITKQVNGLELPDNLAQTQFQEDKKNGQFNGILTNRNFARQVKVEHSQLGFSKTIEQTFTFTPPDGGAPEQKTTKETFDFHGGMSVRNHYFPKGSDTAVDNITNFESAGDGLEYTGAFTYNLTPAQFTNYQTNNSDAQRDANDFFRGSVRALTVSDNVIPSVFAVRPSFFEEGLDYMKQDKTSVILAPQYQDDGGANKGFRHFTGSTGIDSQKFAPSLFAYQSDVMAGLADNKIDDETGEFSQYCMMFENNSIVPPVNVNTVAGENNGEQPNSMYHNSFFAANSGTQPVFFNLQDTADFKRFEDINYFPNSAMTVGTTNFSITFDDTDRTSLYRMSHLHEPRRIPTNDKLGNENKSPSAECYYIQRTVNTFEDINRTVHTDLPTDYPDLFYFQTTADANQISANVDLVNNNLNTISSRLSGVMIRNWAMKTAQKLRTVDKPANKIDNYDDFLTFDEYFQTKQEAAQAWSTTIWAKLGFTYEQIQSDESFENHKFYNLNSEKLNGFTTDAGVSSSVIPLISTMYSKEVHGDDDSIFKTPGEKINTGVQFFNTSDVCIPNKRAEAVYNPNPTNPDADTFQVNRVYQYQNSFYDYAIMAMVETDGKAIQARSLPTLSKHGYFLITSNIGGNTDVVKDSSPVVLLDTVPKSNLANQDFIFNRNELTHTLSNPINLNSIQINILNPDLTNPILNPNSSVLIKIDYPIQKETVIRQDVLDQDAITLMEKQVQIELKNLSNVK